MGFGGGGAVVREVGGRFGDGSWVRGLGVVVAVPWGYWMVGRCCINVRRCHVVLLFAVNVEYVVCLPVIDRVWSERVERQPAYGVKVIYRRSICKATLGI